MKPLSHKRRRLLEALSASTKPADTWLLFRDAHGDYSTGKRWAERKIDILDRMAAHGWVETCGVSKRGDLLWRITPVGRERLATNPRPSREAA